MFRNRKLKALENYPEEYKEEFLRKIRYINYSRGIYASYILVIVSFFMYTVAVFSDDTNQIKTANLIFLIFSLITLILFNIDKPKSMTLNRINKIAVYFEISMAVIWSATLVVIVPIRYEFLSTYSIIIVATAALMFFNWQTTIIGFTLSAIYIIVFSLDKFEQPVLPKISTLISVVIIAVIISRLLYIKETENFIANKNINKKTEELSELNERLIKSEMDAVTANSTKSDFLARMSHDMRTPLTTIMGLADFGIEENRSEIDVEYFSKMKDSAEYLLALVNDTLDLQKLESNKIELNYSIEKSSSATNKVFTIINMESVSKGINFVTNLESRNSGEYIKTDEKRVEQILINVLSNAVKYTPKGGTVKWENSLIPIDDNQLLFRNIITDDGIGMSEEFMKRMYEPFSKEYSSLSKDGNSTGLGLAICKNLIEMMGGNISCESKLGKGTKFILDIPEKIATNDEVQLYIDHRNSIGNIDFAKGKKALICEDSKINANILAKILSEIGMDSDIAENGLMGLDLTKKNDYDMILMDIKMPVMDGIKAAREIRKFNTGIPIIALSANAYKEDIKESLDAGMNAHLAKPFDKASIFKELINLLN